MINLGKLVLYSSKPLASCDVLYSGVATTLLNDENAYSLEDLKTLSTDTIEAQNLIDNMVKTFACNDVDLYNKIKNSMTLEDNVYDTLKNSFEYFDDVFENNIYNYPLIINNGDLLNSNTYEKYSIDNPRLFDKALIRNYINTWGYDVIINRGNDCVTVCGDFANKLSHIVIDMLDIDMSDDEIINIEYEIAYRLYQLMKTFNFQNGKDILNYFIIKYN